jgi:hypothetical protein
MNRTEVYGNHWGNGPVKTFLDDTWRIYSMLASLLPYRVESRAPQ